MPPPRTLRFPSGRWKSAIVSLVFLLLLFSLVADVSLARVIISAGETGMLDEKELVGAASGDPNGGQGKMEFLARPPANPADYEICQSEPASLKDQWPLRLFKRAVKWFRSFVTSAGGH